MGTSALGASGRYVGDLLLDGFRGQGAKEEARRQRLARAVRAKGKAKVERAADDKQCVICLSPPVNPVQVSNTLTCDGVCYLQQIEPSDIR